MKIKQSETVVIKRSQIKFAPYNPRKKDKKVVEALKANYKKVGFMGGVQWNSVTGNLIGGHKRTEAMDLIFNYDGTPEKDYDIKVEKIELDEQTEKEQNIFLNNKRVQGETDLTLMAELVETIDIEAAALTDADIDIIEAVVPNFKRGEKHEIQNDISELTKSSSEKKSHVKDLKKKLKQDISETQQQTHFTIVFKTYTEKAEYLESIGINGDEIFITNTKYFKYLQES